MKRDDDEPKNPQKSDGDSTDEDGPVNSNDSASTVDITNSVNKNHTSEGENGDENHRHNQSFTPLSIVSVHHQNDDNRQALGNNMEASSEKPHSCHTRLEIVVKGVSDQKQEKDRAQDAGRTNNSKKPEEAPEPKSPSEKSLRQSRAAWRAMQFPPDFEKVFKDGSDSNSDTSSSDSDNYRYGRSRKRTGEKADDVSSWTEFVVSDMKPEDVDDNSPSRLKWLRQKGEDNEQNPYLDQLMAMVGLEKVKAHFLAVKDRVKASSSTDPGLAKLRLHLVLHGKDGTGKSSQNKKRKRITDFR
ncbi:hypothetical protein LZ32DRAFT_52805 [Colletotrichum eremochloae]|nr:hypothetical protein LZ32DRAFT_52805 [Colletotrichum eremochloae]